MPGKNSKHPRPRSSRRAPLLRQAPPITPSYHLLDSLIQSHNAIVALVAKLSLQPRFEHASIPGYHRGRGGEWTKTKNKKRNRRKPKNKKKESDAAPGSHAPSSSSSPPQPVRIPPSSPPVPVTSPEKKADQEQSMSTTLPASSSSSPSSISHSIDRVWFDDELFVRCPKCQYLREISGPECCAECRYCSSLFVVLETCRCEHLESFSVNMSDPNWQSQIPTSFPRREVLGQKLPASSSSSSSSSSSTTRTHLPQREEVGLKRPVSIPPDAGTPPKKFHADSKETISSAPPKVIFSERFQGNFVVENLGPGDPLPWHKVPYEAWDSQTNTSQTNTSVS